MYEGNEIELKTRYFSWNFDTSIKIISYSRNHISRLPNMLLWGADNTSQLTRLRKRVSDREQKNVRRVIAVSFIYHYLYAVVCVWKSKIIRITFHLKVEKLHRKCLKRCLLNFLSRKLWYVVMFHGFLFSLSLPLFLLILHGSFFNT